jgi:hypothetical protein
MKNVTKILAASAFALIISNGNAFAQSAEASASASASIISPLAIAQVADMQFGNVAGCSSPSTVLLAVDGSRSVGSGCAVLTAGTSAAAEFAVSGAADNTYAITLPASIQISDGGSNEMTVDSFVSNPSGTGTLDGAGNQSLQVGATLNLAADQPAGSYSGSFNVSVIYN